MNYLSLTTTIFNNILDSFSKCGSLVNMFDKRYIRMKEISLALVGQNSHPVSHHFTFAYCGSRLLSIGMNKPKTHPINLILPHFDRQRHHSISDQVGIHSEVDCILKLGMKDCSKINFFNFRVDKKLNITMSKPCNGCSYLFNKFGYKNIFFTNHEGELIKLK